MHAGFRFTLAATAALSASVFGLTSRASAQDITGTWETSIPQLISNENGVETGSDFMPVTIVISQHGDSVFATWTPGQVAGGNSGTGGAGGAPPVSKPRKMKGVMSNGAAVLNSEPVHAKISRNGDDQEITLLMKYTFKLNGNTLDGTSTASTADGSMPPQEREFKATRKK